MRRRRIALARHSRRSVLTDMLPFEVPPTFSNRGYYKFLESFEVEIVVDRLQWVCPDDRLDKFMRMFFGIDAGEVVEVSTEEAWGATKCYRRAKLKPTNLDTIPYQFSVSHNESGRVLSIPHPRNQLAVACFYRRWESLILYYSSLSRFSIRHPVSVARCAYYFDRLHSKVLDHSRGIEEFGREYEQLGSYFVYEKYQNIHRFFESDEYHECERKFAAMAQLDVSKCFDSIYTHSLAWSLYGKDPTKFSLPASRDTFAGHFDSLMQGLNHKETNGILIGPEFSRIFAELILQGVDVRLERACRDLDIVLGRDFEVFRYVDDYFIFYSRDEVYEHVVAELQARLREMKLSINAAKVRKYERPVITELTMAKDCVAQLLTAQIQPTVEVQELPTGGEVRKFHCAVKTQQLIVRYKAAIKDSGVEYGAVLNYTLAILENKVDDIFKTYVRADRRSKDQENLTRAFLGILEFAFFVFSASPKVNHSVRLCRLVCMAVDVVRAEKVQFDLRHAIFRFVHDGILEHLSRNTMDKHREVESLYLLVVLEKIGKEYWLPENSLAEHFLISFNATKGTYERRDGYLGYFAITVLFSYMKDKLKYEKLRSFLVSHTVEKMEYRKAHFPRDSEAMLLLLDLMVCPYFPEARKVELARCFDISQHELAELQSVSQQWFTAWAQRFSLSKELEAKRSREVY